MIETIKVSSRGQIVIPEKIRKHLDIHEGTNLVLIEKEGKLILEKEESFIKNLEESEQEKEKLGWLILAEQSLTKDWDNEEEDKIWSKYL